MLQFIKDWYRDARRWRQRRIYAEGRTLSRFIARDVKREIMIVSADEIDDGFVTVRMRTTNLLYLSHGLAKKQSFGPDERIAVDDLWKWTGKSWGGLPDGTSIADKSESEIQKL